jgi:hypothetical protein
MGLGNVQQLLAPNVNSQINNNLNGILAGGISTVPGSQKINDLSKELNSG